MKSSDVVLLGVGSIGLFMAGVVWRPVFGNYSVLKDALECTSYIATAIAAVVAIYTLNAWKAQFRYAERFRSIKDLKDAATGMHTFRGYLLAVQATGEALIASNGHPNAELDEKEKQARQKWLVSLEAYNRAWGTAVVFFKPDEERRFPGPAIEFSSRSITDPLKIINAYADARSTGETGGFWVAAREVTEDARSLYRATVNELESMLRNLS